MPTAKVKLASLVFNILNFEFSICLIFASQQTQLVDSKTMLYALRMNSENFGHTTKNKIFRLLKLLADLSTRLYLKMLR